MIINGQGLWKCGSDEDDYGINVPKVILIPPVCVHIRF